MRRIKPLIVSSLYILKYFDIMRHFQRDRAIILMYHRFSNKPDPFKIRQDFFENQIQFLIKKYNFISLKHYLEVLNGQRNDLPDNPVIITIDDGYMDNYAFAYPILKKYNVPATIFLTTDFISRKAWLWSDALEFILKTTHKKSFHFSIAGQTTSFQVDSFNGLHQAQLTIFNYCRILENQKKDCLLDELARHLGVQLSDEVTDSFLPLTWDQIREMQTGGVEYGSHTCSHPIMSRLPVKEIDRELKGSKKEIESNCDAKVDVFCYPNGQHEDISEAVVEQVRHSGYLAAVSTVPGFNCTDITQDLYMLKRIAIATSDRKKMTVRLNRG